VLACAFRARDSIEAGKGDARSHARAWSLSAALASATDCMVRT
jgi:hypothetical protein